MCLQGGVMLNLNPSFREIVYHDVQEYYKCMQITI